MGSQNSYENFIEKTNISDELERLKLQAKFMWEKEKDFFKLLNLSDMISILEVGSGPGFITEELTQSFPNAHITCLEINEDLLSISEKNSALKNNSRINFHKGSIMDCDLPSNSFDLIYTRFVMMHLSNPDSAIKEIYRLLKPGGFSIISEVEDSFQIFSPKREPEYLFKKVSNVLAKIGEDRTIGRRIPILLKESNFQHIKINFSIIHSSIENPSVLQGLFSSSLYVPFVEKNLLTKEEFEIIEKYSKAFFENPKSYFIQGILIIRAQK